MALEDQLAVLNKNLETLIATIGGLGQMALPLQSAPREEQPAQAQSASPAQSAAAGFGETAPAQQAPSTPMDRKTFMDEGVSVLRRHGNNQAPVQALFAKYGVSKPEDLPDEKLAAFLGDLREAYGEPRQ